MSQLASQQSNKNMTDRLTQHHGSEALRDGLGMIRPESQNLRQGTRLCNPYLELAFSVRSRPKAFQPVPRPNVVLDRTSQISEYS
ncbi:hypothetical protein F2Q69_00022943 [Brassica cretica]|uniref:Uncharacterized protein n=1 Tax=Brassica cretica TaxID=69181 RepID=A0A8S9QED1_BRACR|nr:hypothetical protein F2Q69_00022943 [Brassica cretica]